MLFQILGGLIHLSHHFANIGVILGLFDHTLADGPWRLGGHGIGSLIGRLPLLVFGCPRTHANAKVGPYAIGQGRIGRPLAEA